MTVEILFMEPSPRSMHSPNTSLNVQVSTEKMENTIILVPWHPNPYRENRVRVIKG